MEAAERELDAIIVHNIGDLEASLKRAKVEIDARLNGEAWDSLKQALGEDAWYFEDDEEPSDSWFAPRDWLTKNKDGEDDADPWFRLKPLDGKREFHTWLGHYIAPKSDRQQMALVWCWHRFYVEDYKAASNEAEHELCAIRELGFHQDGRELFYPISFDAKLMAEGFREGDLKAALDPIARAADVLRRATIPFSGFREALLKHAR